MSKKLFIIAAFSVALLASAEAFADGWHHGVLQFGNTSKKITDIKIEPKNCFESTSYDNSFTNSYHDVMSVLGELGRNGWELVTVTRSENETIMYFKKPR